MHYQLHKPLNGRQDERAPARSTRSPRIVGAPFSLKVCAVLIPVVIFIVLAILVSSDKALPGELAILNAIHSITSPAITKLAIAITYTGDAPVVVLGALAAVAVLAYRRYVRQAMLLLGAAGGAAVLNVVCKAIFHRDRPELWAHLVHETSYSFPSGHAMVTSAVALALVLLCWQTRWRWLAVGLGSVYVLLVGFSRLYLGVHYPSDVVAGWCLSIAMVLSLHYILRYIWHRQARRSSKP